MPEFFFLIDLRLARSDQSGASSFSYVTPLGEAITVRTTLLVPAILALLLAGPAPAGASDPATELRAQVREVQRIHEAEGMAGLEIASRECWEDTPGFRYLHLDVAAGTLDRRFADAMGVGGHPYFSAEPLLQRARPVFGKANWGWRW